MNQFKLIFLLLVFVLWANSGAFGQNPVSYWPLDGDALDSVGPNNGKLMGDPVWTPAINNHGLLLDGKDDCVDVGSNSSLSSISSSYTIACWIKLNNIKDYNGIFRRASSLDSESSEIEIYFGLGLKKRIATVHNRNSSFYYRYWDFDYSTDVWYHVAVVWDGNSHSWQVYVNGEGLLTSFEGGETASSPKASGFSSYLGAGYYANGTLDGIIDDFYIYDIALTQTQIQDLYQFGTVLPTETPGPTPTPTPTPTVTPTPEPWSSLNGNTLEENNLVEGAPAGFIKGKIAFSEIPEGNGSDGKGMEIKLAPGQGVFIASTKEFELPSLIHLSGNFRADNKEVAIALIGLNSPVDGQIGYTNIRGEEIPVDGYKPMNLIFAPPSGKMQYAIQAVNSPFSTISSTVWVDNITVESFAPIIEGDPVQLEVNGNFEGGLEELLVNINGDDGTVIPFFESITDIALRMSIEPSNTAANIGTVCEGIYEQFPFQLLGQVNVKRDSMPGGGMMALVMTNGYQNLGLFRLADEIKDINDVQEDLLIIGGDFTVNNPDIPISAFVQIGGPDANTSVVVDDLMVLKQ